MPNSDNASCQITYQANAGVPGSGYGLFARHYAFLPGYGLTKAPDPERVEREMAAWRAGRQA